MISPDGEKWNRRLLLVAAGGVFLALAWPSFSRRIYVRSDLRDYFLPIRAFYARALKSGEDFTWYPDIFTGFYLHGDGAASLFHPFNLAGYAWLPLDVAFNLELLRSYPLLFVGMFLLLRRWKLRSDAALFGALVFTFSGFNLLHHLHLNAIATVAHIPWLLWASDVSLRSKSERRASLGGLGVAVLIASALLHGYPQYMLYAGLALGAFVACSLVEGVAWGRVVRLVLLSVCGIAMGALQLLPTLSSLADTMRTQATTDFVYSFSLEPINLLQLVAPYVFTDRVVGGNPHEFGLYAGAAIPALCMGLLLRGPLLGAKRRLALTAALLCAISLVLALGEYGYLYTLQVKLPLLGLLRAPCRYIVLVHLSLSILAAIAFDDLSEEGRTPLSRRSLLAFALPPLLTIAAILAAAMWQGSGAEPPGALSSPLLLLAGTGLVFSATTLVALAARGRRSALLALIALVAVDQGIYGLSYMRAEAPRTLDSLLRELDHPPGMRDGRVRTAGNFPSLLGLRNVGGYVAMRPQRSLGMGVWHQSQFDDSTIAALRLLGVSWVRVPAHDRSGRKANTWIAVKDPMPRIRLVPAASVSRDLWADIAWIDIRSTALVTRTLDLPRGDPGTATLLRDHPGLLQLATQAPSRQLLVVSESHHPGWTATIDGRPAELIVVYGDLMGCVVEAGEHQVELHFDPPSLRMGKQVSAAALLAALVFTAPTLWARRVEAS